MAEVYLWSRDTILSTLHPYPEALFEVARKLTGIMRRAWEIICGLAFQPVAGRLVSLILDILEDPENPSLEQDVTIDTLKQLVEAT